MITRRSAGKAAIGAAAVVAFGVQAAHAADKEVTVGINLSLTGADAESATRIRNGALMAIDDAGMHDTVTLLSAEGRDQGLQDQRHAARRRHRDGRPV